MSTAWIDFEYTDTPGTQLSLIHAAVYEEAEDGAMQYSHYDLRGYSGKEALRGTLRKHKTIGCHSATAEGAALRSLGLDPFQWSWIDTYFLAVLECNGVLDRKTGGSGEDAGGRPKCGLVDVCKRFGIAYTIDKVAALDLIMRGAPFTPDEWLTITVYNAEDAQVLPGLAKAILAAITARYQKTDEEILTICNRHVRWMLHCVDMTLAGIPLDVEACHRLTDAVDIICRNIRHESNAELYPVYLLDGTASYDRMVQWLSHLTDLDKWMKTNSGKYSTSELMFKMSLIPELSKYLSYKRRITAVRWWRNGGKAYDRIGTNNRAHVFLNPYGTVTGRNAPSASRYVFAQSSWLRALVRPDPGKVIVGADFASQEHMIAAVLSDDEVMQDAYYSGDPYISLAISAGAVPENATKHTHKRERGFFKSTALGLQYSMGVKKLRSKLMADTGEAVSEETAKELSDIHHRVYESYWRWVYNISDAAARGSPMFLTDGWSLCTDRGAKTGTIRNWPIQATAGSILRQAVDDLVATGLCPFGVVHDSVYLEVPEAQAEEAAATMSKIMQQAAAKVLGDTIKIRVDTKIQHRDDVWVEDKAVEDIKRYGNILYPTIKEAGDGWKIT